MKPVKRKKKLLILLILTVLFLLTMIISCGDSGNSSNSDANPDNKSNDSPDSGADSDTEAAKEYVYPTDMKGGGRDFKIAAPETTWFFYTDIVHGEMTGEGLDDAIYTRNRFIEDKFDIEFKATYVDIESFNAQLRKLVAAGDDVYDAAFCPMFRGTNFASMISENIFYNLRDIHTLNLEEQWWNQMIIKEASLGRGDKLFFAANDVDIMTLQCLEAVFFNQDMMENLGLELPYNKVREGKWTFDEFNKYQKDGANLNGDTDFRWDKSGNAVYGFISYDNSVNALLDGSGERYVAVDSDGTPRLAVENERFINVLRKIESMLAVTDGTYLFANSMPDFHYEPIFMNGRSMMTMGELKAADVFREMEPTFGILPIPKYDENQEKYYSQHIFATPMTVIPSTNQTPDFAGAVLDAMAYVSNRDVTPVLFDVSVSQKQLRNEESIEMLGLIKNSGSFDVGSAYGWTTDFYNAIRASLGNGQAFSAASAIDKAQDKINASINKTMAMFD